MSTPPAPGTLYLVPAPLERLADASRPRKKL